MKVYDVLPFFNELDVLEIRLKELWDVVDYFVITESNLSHSGNLKNYILLDNWDRFKPYQDKIRHIKVEDMPETTDSWVRERHQRRSGKRGLENLDKEDIVIVSDCDEIARADIIELIKNDENNYDRYILSLAQLQFRINYMKIYPYSKNPNCMVTRGRVFTDPQQEREYTFHWQGPPPQDTVHIDHGGWHFTYFGDDQHAVTKIKNFAHTETNIPKFTENLNIQFMVENKCGLHGPASHEIEHFEYVKVDDYFPKAITDNLEKYQHLIIPGAEFKVTDLYREG